MEDERLQPSLRGASTQPLVTALSTGSHDFLPLSPIQPDPDESDARGGSQGGIQFGIPQPMLSSQSRRSSRSLLSRSSSRNDRGDHNSTEPTSPPPDFTLRPLSATPVSPFSPRTRPTSAASTNASSRPSSAASRPPRSPSDFKLMLDFKGPDLAMNSVLQRRLSTGEPSEDSPRNTPRSPVTLLPHSSVVRTPRSPLPSAGASLCGVPQLPSHYVEQESVMQQARGLLLASRDVVLAGAKNTGGIGKSTVAAALARDIEIQHMYRDGVFWVMMGTRANPMIRAEELKVSLAMHQAKLPLWTPLEKTDTGAALHTWFKQNTAGKQYLLIVDNCSAVAELELFLGTNFRLLITTRDRSLADEISCALCVVPLVSVHHAPKILAAAAGVSESSGKELLQKLQINSLSGLAMEVALIGGTLRNLPQSEWDRVLSRFSSLDVSLEGIYGSAAANMESPLFRLLCTLVIALEQMPPNLAGMFSKLAVLPDSTHIPLHTLQLLWGVTTENEAKEISRQMSAWSLVLITKSDDSGEFLTVHSTFLNFLRNRHCSEVASWHGALMDAYVGGLDHVASVIDDGYVVKNTVHHLKGSVRFDTLRELLFDTDWLERKLHNYGLRAVLDDFERYLVSRRDPQIHTLSRALQLAAPAALAHPQLAMLGVQMAGRLMAHWGQPLIPDWIIFIRALLDEESYSQGVVPLWPLTASLGQVAGGHLAMLCGHTSWVTSVVMGPNGTWAATSSTDRTAIVWDLCTGRRRHVLEGHQDHVAALGVSHCGRALITASRDASAAVWDVCTGMQISSMSGHERAINCCSVHGTSESGFVVTGADDCTARIWRLPGGGCQHVLYGHTDKVRSVLVTSNGQWIVTSSDDTTARVWSYPDGQCCHVLEGHSDKIGVVVPVAGGNGGVLTLSSDATARLWGVQSGKCMHILRGHKAVVSGAAATANGEIAVTVSGDKMGRVWNLLTGQCKHVLEGHNNWVNGVAIFREQMAITVSVDKSAQIWDLSTGNCITNLQGHRSLISAVVVTPDHSKALTISSDNSARLWSLTDGQVVYGSGHDSRVTCIQVLPDGERCVSSGHDGQVILWDTASGLPSPVQLHAEEDLPQQLSSVAVSGDGGSIAVATGKSIYVWDLGILGLQPRLLHALKDATANISSLSLSGDSGAVIVAGSADGTARIWDAASGACHAVLAGHRNAIIHVMLIEEPASSKPDAAGTKELYVVTASIDGTARVWDLTGGMLASLEGHTGALTCCLQARLQSCGNNIVTGSRDCSLRVWAASSENGGPNHAVKGLRRWLCRLQLEGHCSPVTAAAAVSWSAESVDQRLVSGAQDGSLIIWDLSDGTSLHRLEAHTAEVRCVSPGICDVWQRRKLNHPAAALLLSCGDDGCAIIWDVVTGCQVGLFRADFPLICCRLSTAQTQSGSATAVVGEANGNMHFLQLPRR